MAGHIKANLNIVYVDAKVIFPNARSNSKVTPEKPKTAP